jgi:hypothetical protein
VNVAPLILLFEGKEPTTPSGTNGLLLLQPLPGRELPGKRLTIKFHKHCNAFRELHSATPRG